MESAQKFEEVKGIVSDLLQMDVTQRYPYIVDALSEINNLIGQKSYNIAVVGEFSSGKSTFLNALMGRDLLPHGVTETTAAVTYIHNVPENSDMVNRVCIHFNDPSIAPVDERLDNDSFSLREVLSTNSKSYSVAAQIDRVDIYVHFLDLDEPIVLMDTPGTNGMAERHREILLQAVHQAHACICLFPLRGLGKTDVKFMRSLMNSQTEFFFVLNHIDDLKEGEETREERLAKFNKEILQDLFLDNDVQIRTYGISALKAMAARDRSIKRLYSDSSEDILDEDRGLLLEQSGVPEFENDLIQYVKNGAIEAGILNTVLHRVDECVKVILGDLSIKESVINTNPAIDVLQNALDMIDERYSVFESRRKKQVATKLLDLQDETLRMAKDACEAKRVALKQFFANQVEAETTDEGLRQMVDDDYCKEQLEAFWVEITGSLQDFIREGITIIIEAAALQFSNEVNVVDFKRRDTLPEQPVPDFEVKGDFSSEFRLNQLKARRDELLEKIKELGDADTLKKRLSSISSDIDERNKRKEKLRRSHDDELHSLGTRPAIEYKQVTEKKDRKLLWIFKLPPKKTITTVLDYSKQKKYDEKVAQLDSKYRECRDSLTKDLKQLQEDKQAVQERIDLYKSLEGRIDRTESMIQEAETRYQEDRKLYIRNIKKKLLESINLQIEKALGNTISSGDALYGTIYSDLDHGVRAHQDKILSYVEEQLTILYRNIAEMAKKRLNDVIASEKKGDKDDQEVILEKERTQVNEIYNRIMNLYGAELS